jgi:hypothetical protein
MQTAFEHFTPYQLLQGFGIKNGCKSYANCKSWVAFSGYLFCHDAVEGKDLLACQALRLVFFGNDE